MGYIRHNAIIVTGDSYQGAQQDFEMAHKKAKKLFGNLVSDTIKGVINGYQSFFVAPDGSKEYWTESDEFDEKRKMLAGFIDSLAHSDGGNSLQFVDVGFGDSYDTKIDRQNRSFVGRESNNDE